MSTVSGPAPYKTRMVVVRPVDAAPFTGRDRALEQRLRRYENFGGGGEP
jgi:hypothetical protein